MVLARVPLDKCLTSTVPNDHDRGVSQITWKLRRRAIAAMGNCVFSALHFANHLMEHVPLVRDGEEVSTFGPIIVALCEPQAVVGDNDESCLSKPTCDRPTRREVPVRRRRGDMI